MNEHPKKVPNMFHTLNLMLAAAALGWTLVSVGSFLYHIRDSKQHIEHIAAETARESINRDKLYRFWAAQHGPLYVPVTEQTPPNPSLSVMRERDITTPSGRRLTLMNPAYMTRQINSLADSFTQVKGHITSLNPLRPENAPDPWEVKALQALESGSKRFGEVVAYQGSEHYRLMVPLYVEKPCLRCHAAQGYALGELRGGMSASLPMALFAEVSRQHLVSEAKHFGGIWLMGIAGIAFAAPFVRRRISEREAAVEHVEKSEDRLRSMVDNAPFGAHLYRLERDGRLLFTGANAAADRILGIEHGQFIGRTIEDAFPGLRGTKTPDTYRQVAETGRPAEFEHIEYHAGAINGVFEVHAVQTAPQQIAVFFRDITERSRVERALMESEERLKEAQRIGRIGSWEWAVADDRLWWSDEVYHLFGMTSGQDITVDGFLQRIHPDERERVRLTRQEVVEHAQRDWQTEYRIVRPDGEIRHLYESARSDVDAKGRVRRWHGIVQDITMRKQAEETLRRNRDFTQSIIENEPECVKILGPGSILKYMNPAGLAMIEVDSLDQVVGQAVLPLVAPEHRESFSKLTEEVLRGGSGMLEFEMTGMRGTRRWLETHAVPLRDGAGRVESLLGITRDVTERRRAEQGLRESQARLDLAIRAAKMGVWNWDIKNDVRTFEAQVCLLLGLEPSTFTGRAEEFYGALHPEDRELVKMALARTMERDAPYEPEYRSVWPDGSVHFIAARGTLFRDAAGRPERITGIAWDITERKMAEEQRRKLEEQLLQSQKIESVGRLAGGVAHDINNMLTPILGYADMLGTRIPEDDPARDDLNEIISAANRVKDMTHQLLAFARKQTLDIRPIDINVVISRFGKMLHRTLREDILVALTLAPSIGAVLADERQIEQVILNLAVNAQDAMPKGGVLMISTKNVVIDPSFVETRPGISPGRYTLIKVADSGMGMDQDIRSRIFEPFYTTKESGRGTGLGLSTVYGIVKQHKGYIDVETEPRQGASFFIYLPVVEEVVGDHQESTQVGLLRGSETILVVEDQVEVLTIVKQLLEKLGYRVLTARGSGEAHAALRGEHSAADLLITDVIMPGSNGRELYEQMKRDFPLLKVLYMSGYPADVISTHGVLDKGVHFLRKPFSTQELSEAVRQVIDGT